jgi:hypothetical protein
MKKEADAGGLPAHLENGGDKSGTTDCRMGQWVGRISLEKQAKTGAKVVRKSGTDGRVSDNRGTPRLSA